jgi:hypothetical protein
MKIYPKMDSGDLTHHQENILKADLLRISYDYGRFGNIMLTIRGCHWAKYGEKEISGKQLPAGARSSQKEVDFVYWRPDNT